MLGEQDRQGNNVGPMVYEACKLILKMHEWWWWTVADEIGQYNDAEIDGCFYLQVLINFVVYASLSLDVNTIISIHPSILL